MKKLIIILIALVACSFAKSPHKHHKQTIPYGNYIPLECYNIQPTFTDTFHFAMSPKLDTLFSYDCVSDIGPDACYWSNWGYVSPKGTIASDIIIHADTTKLVYPDKSFYPCKVKRHTIVTSYFYR